jgi:hypothetical protein
VGVYADIVTVPDMLTDQLVGTKRLTNAQLAEVAADMLVIRTLGPLIRAGVMTFRNPAARMCEHHYAEFEELNFKWRNDFIEIDTGRLYDPPVENFAPLSDEQRRELEAGRNVEDVGVALFEPMMRSTFEVSSLTSVPLLKLIPRCSLLQGSTCFR